MNVVRDTNAAAPRAFGGAGVLLTKRLAERDSDSSIRSAAASDPAEATHCVAPGRRLERASAEAEGGAAGTVGW